MSTYGRDQARARHQEIQAGLERDLIEWADDVSLRLVWAELLQMGGDPLGRLIVLDHLGETHPELRPEAEALRQSLAGWFQIPRDREFTLHWKRGFVHTLEVRPRGRQPATIARQLQDALRRPALRFLECVHVIVPDTEAGVWPSPILWQVSHPTLREVHFGDPPTLRERPAGAYEPGRGQRSYDFSDRADALTRFPRLRWASVAGELIRLACCDGSPATRKHSIDKLAGRPLTSRNRTSLIRAIWDPSSLVHDAAFATIVRLGPLAEFVLDDLELMLRPPLGARDPRPARAFEGLAAIGAASASMLPDVLARDLAPILGRIPRHSWVGGNGPAGSELLTTEDARCVAFLGWLRALAKAGRPAVKIVGGLLARNADEVPSSVRRAAKAALEALLAE